MSGYNSTRMKEISSDVVDLQAEINSLRSDAEEQAQLEAKKLLEEKKQQDKRDHVA